MLKMIVSAILLMTAGCNFQTNVSDVLKSANIAENGESIIGGKPATSSGLIMSPAVHSTVALVGVYNGLYEPFCTGTLISKNLIMTASHCVADLNSKDEVKVFFGGSSLKKINGKSLYKVEDFITHPDYLNKWQADQHLFNDIALVKLAQDAPEGFTPVEILDKSYKLTQGQEILLAGYGVIDDEQMSAAVSLNFVHVPFVSLHKESLLITDQRNSKGACAGDSGGPAYLESNGKLMVFGVTRGPHEDVLDCHHYGQYTYASMFQEFITESALKLGAKAPVFAAPLATDNAL